MRWSGLRKKLESNFASALGSRVSIHSTRYGNCTCGRAWITLDKVTIANFCTRAFFVCEYFDQHTPPSKDEHARRDKNYKNQLVDYGEISRQGIYEAAWSFVHDTAFDDALKSNCPFTQSLAVLDKRLGKRRMQKMAELVTHPLPKKLLEIRMKAEGMKIGENCLSD